MGTPRPALAVFRPAALLALAAAVLTTRADPDLWGHTRFGLDILRDGVLTAADPYSYTHDRSWVNHEWLSETAMGTAYLIGGAWGLVALKMVVALGVFALIWREIRDRAFAWRWTALTFVGLSTFPIFFTVRPQLWTGLAVVLLCRALVRPSPLATWTLPAIFVLWANLHGGWLVGGGVLALWTATALATRNPYSHQWLLAGIVSLLATLLNPYGPGLWQFLAETVRFGRADIVEWQPIWVLGWNAMLLWTVTMTFVIVTLWHARQRPLPVVLVLAAMAIASARVLRLGPLFALMAVMLTAHLWPSAESDPIERPARRLWEGVTVAVLLAAALAAQLIPRCVVNGGPLSPDTVAADALRGRSGRVATHFDWGQYAIWHFGPDLKVSMDGRRETVYSDSQLTRQVSIAEGTEEGLTELAQARPEYVWLPTSSETTSRWLTANGYRLDVRTPRSFVAARSDLPPLQQWTGSPSGCFPGP